MASGPCKNLPLGLLALTTIVHADLLDTEDKPFAWPQGSLGVEAVSKHPLS